MHMYKYGSTLTLLVLAFATSSFGPFCVGIRKVGS